MALRYVLLLLLALVATPVLADTYVDLQGEITPVSALVTIAQIREAPMGERIVVKINTPGGNVAAGMAIARAIRDSAVPVTCVVDGMAASMGFYILQFCPTRVMTIGSLLMIHEPSAVLDNSFTRQELRTVAGRMDAFARALALPVAKRLGLPVEEFEARIAGKDWWMASDEALAIGAVDAVL